MKNKTDLWIAFFLAAFFSILYFLTFSHSLLLHESYVLSAAKGIASYGFPTEQGFSVYFHPPLLMYIVAIFFVLTRDIFLAGEIATLLFSFGAVFLLYLVARRYFDRFFSVILTVFSAGSTAFWFMANTTQMEIAVLFFGLCGILTALSLEQKYSNKKLVLFGVIIGLGLLTKSSALLFSGPAILYFIFTQHAQNTGHFTIFKRFLGLLLISLTVMSPLFIFHLASHQPLYTDPAPIVRFLSIPGFGPSVFPSFGFYYSQIFKIENLVFLSFAIVGAVWAIKYKKTPLLLPVLIILAHFLFYSMFTLIFIKYLFPIEPLIMILAIYGIRQTIMGDCSEQ